MNRKAMLCYWSEQQRSKPFNGAHWLEMQCQYGLISSEAHMHVSRCPNIPALPWWHQQQQAMNPSSTQPAGWVLNLHSMGILRLASAQCHVSQCQQQLQAMHETRHAGRAAMVSQPCQEMHGQLPALQQGLRLQLETTIRSTSQSLPHPLRCPHSATHLEYDFQS
jgi:hypothetical protein